MLSKWTWLIPCESTTLPEVYFKLKTIVFKEVGVPFLIRADNAFLPLRDTLFDEQGVILRCGLAGNPRSQACVERPNRSEKRRVLVTCKKLKRWVRHVPTL